MSQAEIDKSMSHLGEPCRYCKTSHDNVLPGECVARKKLYWDISELITSNTILDVDESIICTEDLMVIITKHEGEAFGRNTGTGEPPIRYRRLE